MLLGRRSVALGLLTTAACGGSSPSINVKERAAPPADAPPQSSITTVKEETKPEPFKATSGPGDAPVAYVRDERSSRLDVGLPRGRPRELWAVSSGKRQACNGSCKSDDQSFVIAAGNRVAVIGGEGWILFDPNGRRVDSGKMESVGVRLDRASGLIVPDQTRAADTPVDAKVAAHDGMVVLVSNGGVHVGERAIEGKFDAIEVAIDDAAIACVIVRQGADLLLWTVPIAAGASIGRHKIPGGIRHVVAPPILGRRLRVISLDNGLLALSHDGKRVWERRGMPSGGATITADDQVLVADGGRITSIDSRGKTTDLAIVKDVTFVSPPIISAANVLYVASTESLHAFAFS